MYLWTNDFTNEQYRNEKPYITIGGNCLGTKTHAFLGDSNVILFSVPGNLSVERMNEIFFENGDWIIEEE